MAWFFSDNVSKPIHCIVGEDAKHIAKSLRMSAGESVTVCDSNQIQHECVIESIDSNQVVVRVMDSFSCENEPNTRVTLYQALPKSDKMDFIIQKAVELGVAEIVPVMTARCVSRPDEKSMKKKLERWNKIAVQASMQSRRGMIPQVLPIMKLEDAAQRSKKTCSIVCYELGGKAMGKILSGGEKEVSLFIGSEGGFETAEIGYLAGCGCSVATLGNRILRAETAPLAALSVIMYITDNLGN